MRDALAKIPTPALFLGLAGLIPFLVGGFGAWLAEPAAAALALNAMLGYGAVILSFLGGVHWGRALAPDIAMRPSWMQLIWSVTPALIGWGAMFTGQIYSVLVIYLIAFTLAFIVDAKAVRGGLLPAWYGTLRKILTTGVILSLAVALYAVFDASRFAGG